MCTIYKKKCHVLKGRKYLPRAPKVHPADAESKSILNQRRLGFTFRSANFHPNLYLLSSLPPTMLPSHLNGHSPLAHRRPRLSAAAPPAADASSAAGAGSATAAASLEEHDRIYFQSYSHIGIHETMIKVSHLPRRCHPHIIEPLPHPDPKTLKP
jgi:hypothetical protein